MSDTTSRQAGLAVRASDAEREHTVALLQHGFADGRLTQDELEERAAAAYAARTTAELSDLTVDLPAEQRPPRPGRIQDRCLLCILLCVHPPAALVYWLLSHRRQPGRPDPEPATPPGAGRGDLRTTIETTDTVISRPESADRGDTGRDSPASAAPASATTTGWAGPAAG